MIYLNSAFKPTANGHGGNHRSLQIRDILCELNIDFSDLPQPPTLFQRFLKIIPLSFSSLINLVEGFWTILEHLRKKQGSPVIHFSKSFLIFLISNLWWWTFLSKTFPKSKGWAHTIIWERTLFDSIAIAIFANKRGLKLLAIPHNIESLVPHQEYPFSNISLKKRLKYEMSLLQSADACFTISPEDTRIASQYNVIATCLPYFPTSILLKRLSEIRQKRSKPKKSVSNQILLLGSASNPPTRKAFQELLTFWSSNPQMPPLDVVGYGAELVFNTFRQAKNVIIHGTVNEEILDNFLVNCKCVIVHQKSTTGFLTRIAEFATAGIPVIASKESVKKETHTYFSGIFHHFTEIEQIISNADFELPTLQTQKEEIILKELLLRTLTQKPIQ